ncbi:MAG: hypothetical protein JKY60_15705, partial [Kordiimonadaceae bacterium]|nr:hypothetical protein [Kordiimonadaceae bacterium]
MRLGFLSASLLAAALAFPALSYDDEDKPCAQGNCKSSWSGTGAAEQKPAIDLAKDYKAFLNVARTELLTVAYAIEEAKKHGFQVVTGGLINVIEFVDNVFTTVKNESQAGPISISSSGSALDGSESSLLVERCVFSKCSSDRGSAVTFS